MNRTIWKWSLDIADRQILMLPAGAQVLAVQVQGLSPQLWALVDPDEPPEPRVFATCGTGREVGDWDYIGTYQVPSVVGGSLVFHVFEVDHGA